MPGDSTDHPIAPCPSRSCVEALKPHMSGPIETKAPTTVNRVLVAPGVNNCGQMPQGGSDLVSSYPRDLGPPIHRAESSRVHGSRAKREPDRPEIMPPDVSAL